MNIKLAILLVVPNCYLFSQNLVKNGSFETFSFDKKASDTSWIIDFNLQSWKKYGTVDLYCNNRKVFQNQNFIDYLQPPFAVIDSNDGNFFMGLLINEEMLKGSLTESLTKDSIYNFSLYLKLNSFDKTIPKELSVCITEDDYTMVKYKNIYYKLYGEYGTRNYFRDMKTITLNNPQNFVEKWTKVEFKYKARGGERYIYFYNPNIRGVFNKKRNLDRAPHKPYNGKYLLIDNICLRSANMPYSLPIFNSDNDSLLIGVDGTMKWVIPNLQFALNDCHPDTSSLKGVNLIINEINQQYSPSNYKLIVEGFTDNQGDSLANMALSLCRAESVRDYLIRLGVDKDKVEAIGYGMKNPIESNASEVGRSNNRRVQVRIVFE